MKKMKKKVYFLVRYSVLSAKQGYWVIRRNTELEEYKETLFSDTRMRLHSQLFFGLTVPALDNAISNSSVDAACIVLTSTELPTEHKKKLYDECARYGWMQVREVAPDKSYIEELEDLVGQSLDAEDDDKVLCCTVRIDDDDAVSKDFLQQLEKYLKFGNSGFAVSLAKGYKVFLEGEKITHFAEYFHAKGSVGLAYMKIRARNSGPFQTVYSFGDHMKIDRKTRLIVDGRKASFLRAIHDQSDITQEKGDRKSSSDVRVKLETVAKNFVIQESMLETEDAK